ncbi:MAG TPA: dephospho-CoA kinase [Candidatus Dormibacteraeota bacterium]|nr:dephospho-CoA kinase [Candidatus Dormibacteraeota bacterium]
MKLVGLTGGVGSGKSTVAGMLRELGATVVDADEAAHAAYEPGSPGFDAVVREFGQEFVTDGRIDRARLGELVFHDADARLRLNSIVHPLVREWMAQKTAQASNDGADIVVQDVPLLFENGLEKLFSSVVLVYVPEAVQLERLVTGRGFKRERALAMITAQMPIENKRGLAPHVINNSRSLEETRSQVEAVWKVLASD